MEMENWIYSIHLACAASFARHLGRDSTVKLLSSEIHKLENSIDLVSSLLKHIQVPKSTQILKSLPDFDLLHANGASYNCLESAFAENLIKPISSVKNNCPEYLERKQVSEISRIYMALSKAGTVVDVYTTHSTVTVSMSPKYIVQFVCVYILYIKATI